MRVGEWVKALHEEKVREGYFGEVRLTYQGGRIVHVREERSQKPPPGLQPDEVDTPPQEIRHG